MFNLKKRLAYYIRVARLLDPVMLALFVACVIAQLLALRFRRQGWAPVWSLWPESWPLWILAGAMVACDLALAFATVRILDRLLGDFVRAVYGLKDSDEGRRFVWRRLFGTPSLKPFIRVAEGKLLAADGKPLTDDKHPLMRVGGPGSLIIYNDSAVVLEKAGKLTRVCKKGFSTLEAFERIWDVVDLRPYRWVYDVSAMSKDGIPVTCQADITFQIDDGGQTPTEDDPFPADEEAVFLAATRKWMREADRSEHDRTLDWARKAIIGMTEGALRSILATYLLDQFLGPDELTWSHHRSAIRNKLEASLRQSFPTLGAKLIKVELGGIKVADEIAQRRIEAWQAWWKRWAKAREAEGEAERLQAVEAAKAQAQADMIVAITQAFHSLSEAGAFIPSQLVLLRMFEVLKRTSFDPQTGMLFLPAEVLKTWQLVQEIALGKRALPEGKEKDE